MQLLCALDQDRESRIQKKCIGAQLRGSVVGHRFKYLFSYMLIAFIFPRSGLFGKLICMAPVHGQLFIIYHFTYQMAMARKINSISWYYVLFKNIRIQYKFLS